MRLSLLLGVSITLMLIMGLLAARSLSTLNSAVDWLTHTERVRFEIGRTLQLLTDIETAARGFAISHDERFLEPYVMGHPELELALQHLERLIADNATQRRLFTRLQDLAYQRAASAGQVIERVRAGEFAQAQALIASGEGKRIMDAARAVVAQMQSEESSLLTLRAAEGTHARENAEIVFWGMGALAIGLLALVAYVSVRDAARLRHAEAALAAALRSVGDGVISTDASGRIQFMNAVAEQLTGSIEKRARDLPLDEVFRIVNENTRAVVENPVAKVLREGAIVGLANHTVLIARDGSERAIEDSAATITGASGELQGVVLVFRDATTQREAQHALLASEARFRAAVSAVQGVLWTNTAQGEMRGEQPSWSALTGQSFDEYQGFGWSRAVHPQDAQPTIDAWLVAVQERRPFAFEHRVRRYDGQWRNFSIHAIPVLATDGSIREWVGVHTDITEQRWREEQLRASEARFRAVQETSIDGFMVLESVRDEAGQLIDFRWIHANAAAERIVGQPRDWFIGRRLLEEMPGNRKEGLFAEYVKVVETGEPWTHEFTYQHEGVNAYLRLVAAKSQDGFACTFADLSERRRAEEQVRERERRFVGLANTIPQLAWSNRPDGTYEYFNRGWYAYTGLTESESLRADVWARVVHPDEAKHAARVWNHCLSVAEPYEVEFRLRRHDGAYRWFLARALADRNEEGRLIEWFGTCTDIDHTKRNEENLRATETALREADTRKDVFLATLSHELRNPLAPIRTAARILEMPNLGSEDLQRSRLIIARQVTHMASLLNDLLDVSRITRGVFPLKKEYVELQELLSEAVEAARPLIDAKQHTLILEWPAQTAQIEVDPVRFVQIATNLLTNAAKYTDVNGHITFGVRLNDEFLLLIVRDTGVGLAPTELAKVFEMFAQVTPDQERSEGGLGIGLALVKGLVELHGGYVEAHSEGLGRGSEFRVYLPHASIEQGPQLEQQPPTDSAVLLRTLTHILIADDNHDGADSLAMLLRLSGYEVRITHSGSEAVELIKATRPDAAILDIGMPGMNGFEVAQAVRREAWGSKIKLIAVTGWGQQDDKRAALAAGFDHHLTKPVDLTELERLL